VFSIIITLAQAPLIFRQPSRELWAGVGYLFMVEDQMILLCRTYTL
jgi:hypothetical protein